MGKAFEDFAGTLNGQRKHERSVDELINLFGLKPDDDNLNPPK